MLDPAASEWPEFLRGTTHDFYHLPGYASTCAVQEQGRAAALLVDDGRRSLLVPLILRPIPGCDREDAASPYGYPGPIVHGTDQPHFTAEALAAGLHALAETGAVSAFIRFHPLLNTSLPRGVGQVVVHGHTVGIDLTRSADELWAATRRNHRRDITRALAGGSVAFMDPAFEHYGTFKELYRATLDRLGADPYYYFDDAYFEGLRDALGERLHLCVVTKGDAVAAASLFGETCGIVQHHLTGVNELLGRAEASKLMVHFARGWAKERGDRWLHLGGGVGGGDDSLLHYKAGFATNQARHRFATLRVILDPKAYRALARTRAAKADPASLGGFFPAYRAEVRGMEIRPPRARAPLPATRGGLPT